MRSSQVSYPWRNTSDEPLRLKGAFVSSLERIASGYSRANSFLSLHSAEEAIHYQPLPPSSETDGKPRKLYVGFGFFGGESEELNSSPAKVPPSLAAAKAATAELSRQLAACGSQDNSPLQTIMQDKSGRLAAFAAEAHCWDAIELPMELGETLREHTCLHIGAFDS